MTEDDKKLANSMWWWHKIKLSEDYTTPGHCPHGTGEDVETRFGLPKDLTNKRVLDIGGWDGLFSFEAENRWAKRIWMIDRYQTPKNGDLDPNAPFQLAKKILNSAVHYTANTLEDFEAPLNYFPDYIFYFGVLYHIKNPLGAVEKLSKLASSGTVILLETAISDINHWKPILEYRPGFDNDPTNQFYPNKQWIETAFMQHGAKSVEQIWTDGGRSSFRIQY